MYEMTLDGNTFFAPANNRYTLLQLVTHEALNDAGYIDAQVPSTNPLYDAIEAGKSKVELFKDNKSKFRGYIVNVSLDFNKTKTLYIVGEMSYLNDTIQLQRNVTGKTKAQLLSEYLTYHNAQSNEKFYAGKVATNPSVSAELVDSGYTLDLIREVICGDDGYIKIVDRNGRREVDILPIEDYGKQSEQYIKFGSNLLDYTQDLNGDSVVTAIYPRGAKLEESTVEGLDSYLDISSLNGGSPILVNSAAVNKYGYRCRIVDFETDDKTLLLKLARDYLSKYQFIGASFRLTAVDLSQLDSSQDDYELGDYIRATAEPFELDTWLPVRAKDTDIIDLTQNVIELGMSFTNSLTQATSSQLTNIVAQMPQQNSILETAKKNATALIVDATTGYVTVRPSEITIADNADINKAVKLWRWNSGGFGYSKNGYKGKYGTAITMDGAIVADFITTGVLRSLRIENGTRPDGTAPFYVTPDGKLYAESGTFKGDVSAASLGGGAGDTVKQAIDTANRAIQLAQQAAQTAQKTANGAQTTADDAKRAASSAQIAVDAANIAVDAANTAADAAKKTANAANSTANDAKITADSAYDYANRIAASLGSHLGGWEYTRIYDKTGQILYSGWLFTSHDRPPGY